MFGYTLPEMIPSPPDSVRGVSVDPPESECQPLLHYLIRKQNRKPISRPSHRLSVAPGLIPTLWYFLHVLVFHIYRAKLFLEKSFEIEDVSQKDSENA